MTFPDQPTIIIPAHLASSIRTAIPSAGLLLGSLHDSTFIVKQLVNVPWSEAVALKSFYSDPELTLIGWFMQVTEDKSTIKSKNLREHFKETDLRMGLMRSYNEFHGFHLANESVQECDVGIPGRSGLSTFLRDCYDIEPFIDDTRYAMQSCDAIDALPDLTNIPLMESYRRACLDYETVVALYRLLMLPDEVLIKRLQSLDAYEERKRRLESCFKDASLSPEQLMRCLASLNVNYPNK